MKKILLALLFPLLFLAQAGSTAAPEKNGSMLISGWPKANRGMGYNLYMSTSSGKDYKKVNVAPITEASFLVKNVESGRRYYFVLTMISQSGGKPVESMPSQEFSALAPVYTQAASADSAPLPIQGRNEGWVELKGWRQPGAGEGIFIYMSEFSGRNYKKMNTEPITGLSHRISGLKAGKQYYFVMTMAGRDGKQSKPSQEWSLPARPGQGHPPMHPPDTKESNSGDSAR
jgi:fibronectin type 3 domain-containing protein